jgi:hypothetical protein
MEVVLMIYKTVFPATVHEVKETPR